MRYSTPLALVLLLSLSACGRPSGDRGAERRVLFFAAASATEAASRAVEAFEARSGIAVATSFASSATLAQQILAGAEAGVFLSAHRDWVEVLEGAELVTERTELLGNSLVLIVPRDSELTFGRPGDFDTNSVEYFALGDPDTVPAGIYAKEALVTLGLWETLRAKVVRGADVRQALLFVELGEADAGIVYATDAAMTDAVRIEARLDSALAAPIRYSLVLLSGDAGARRLYDFLRSPEGAEIFSDFGFEALHPL